MSYYNVLGLKKEPFSTSPDPNFFYRSSGHNTALKRLEIAIRLKRGLNLILGDVGTGKTTLARTIFQILGIEDDFIFKMILDPNFKSEFQFISYLTKIFEVNPEFNSTLDHKEALERFLFQKGVDEGKTIVLLIDEGQKMSSGMLEFLRMLLNYETNEFKLLQLVIMSQMELLPRLRKIRNFMDRLNLKYVLNPLDEIETRRMIDFRLRQAGYTSNTSLFTNEAVHLIYSFTHGYPRRIAMICHNALEKIVMNEQLIVEDDIIRELIKEEELV